MAMIKVRKGDGAICAVGEQYYSRSLRKAWKHVPPSGEVAVALIPEPTNKHDPNAIKMLIHAGNEWHMAGYVPADEAAALAAQLNALTARGDTAYGYGKIRKYPDQFQVYLLASTDPERLLSPRLTDPIGEYIDGWYPLTVVGEEQYQDVLSPYATTSREYVFALHPSTVRSGKYAGEPTYAVYLDGQIVGALTRAMAKKHGPVLERVLRRGRRPYLTGHLETDHRGLQVVLDGPRRE